MNNYAVSSDGIATALQDSASALMEAGNNLEQSVALVAAANKVVQDPNSVGSALRTISLRLRGTSVEILEEMGEETDGVVESVSKMQEKIKALTGVDILTDSGDYKDTYTILYEIGQVWNDIENLDRSALLELMAGKNRANTLAAILNNMEDLEGAYNSALGAEGSALKENAAYMDSVQGKIDLVTNSIQTMWMNFIDSDVLKFFLDVANALVKIADKTGLIGSLMAVFSGFNAAKKDSLISSLFSGFDDGLEEALTNLFSGNIFKSLESDLDDISEDIYEQLSFDDISDSIDDIERQLSFDDIGVDGWTDYMDEMAESSDRAANSTVDLNNATVAQGKSSQQTADKNNKNAESIKGVGTASIFAKGAVSLFRIAVSSLASALIGMAIQKVIEYFYNLAHAEEQAAERAADAINKYNDTKKSLDKQKKTADELAKTYTKLSGGVNTETNRNIGLTTEAYEEYLDVCNQIADIYPELITGYDTQGNAILSLKGKVDELNDAYQRAAESAALMLLKDENKKDVWTAYESNAPVKSWTSNKGKEYHETTISDTKDLLEALQTATESDLEILAGHTYEGWNVLRNLLQERGLYTNDAEMISLMTELKLDHSSVDAFKSSINSALSEVNQSIASATGGIRETISANLIFNEVYQGLDESSKGIAKAILNNLTPEIIAESGANSVDEFYKWFSSNIVEKIADGNYQDVFSKVTNISDELARAMLGGDSAAFKTAKSQFDELIKEWVSPETGDIVIDEDSDFVTQYLQRMAKSIQEQSKNYEIRLQMQTEFDSPTKVGELITKYTGQYADDIQNAFDGLGVGSYSRIKDVYDQISAKWDDEDGVLRSDELSKSYDEYIEAINAGDESLQGLKDAGWSDNQIDAIKAVDAVMKLYGTDIDTVIAKLIELGYVQPVLDDISSFNLASESTQEKVSEFESTIASIKDAWNALNDKSMTKSEFIELAMDFPELMDGVNLSDDNWMVKAKENLEELNAIKIDDFIDTLETAKEAMQARGEDTSVVDSFINYVNQIKTQPLIDAEVYIKPETISGLSETVDNYKSIIAETNEVLHDGQKVSDGYYDSLKEYIDDVEELDSCFDKNNKNIVVNAKKLKQLVAQSKNAQRATIHVAKAQAQLEYKDLVNQIRSAVTAMGNEYKAYGFVTNATLDNVSAMREQLATLKQTIQQYALLEISLSKAASAYDEYEKAKERDSKLTYDESFEEMLKTIDEGLLKNETGTEAFEYAVKAVVPEQFWKDIDDVNEKVKSIHDYIDGDPIFSKLFTVDEEGGGLSVTTDNVREFIKISQEAGLIEGGPEGFSLTDKVNGVESFAEALGITEAAALALLSATEDCDAMWGNILTDVMTNPLDREINKSVNEVDKATQALEDYYKLVSDPASNVDFNSEVYKKLCADLEAANKRLQENQQAAQDNVKTYNTLQAALSSCRGDLSLTDGEAQKLVGSLKQIAGLEDLGEIKIENGQLKLTDEQMTMILKKLGLITEPSVMQVQLRYDEISAEIDELQTYIDEGCKGTITIDGVKITNEEEAQQKLNELTPEKNEIEFTYNITETSTDAEKSVLESYKELAANGLEFTVTAIVDGAKEGLDTISDAQRNIDEEQEITITAYAWSAEQAIKAVADQLDRIKSKTVILTVSQSGDGVNALGNAMATGNAGLNSAEHNSIVGELGPEMVVDPIKGVYYTVGNNGTEMVDLPRGAIIYNHKQTEELLKNGHTTRGKYTGGLSFASGNAHADYGIPSYHPNTTDKTSFENGQGINNEWNDVVSELSDVSSDLSDAAGDLKEAFDWIEVRLAELDETLGLLNAQLANAANYSAKNNIIDKIIGTNETKIKNLSAGIEEYTKYASKLLAKVPAEYQEAAQNGAIAITQFAEEADDATLEAINNYREWAQKVADLKQQLEEVKTEIKDLAIQKVDNARESGDVRATVEDSQTEKLQNAVDLIEESGRIADAAYYEAMMENSNKKIEYLTASRNAMQEELDNAVESGQIERGSNEWYELVNQMYEVDAAIDEATLELEQFQNAINDIYWDNFDQLINRIGYLKDETQSLIDLMDKTDLVDEDGSWKDEGITSLGLYAQQMEIAEYESKQYAEAIDQLTADYEAGKYSESEYYEKLNELKSAQYDAIESYNDAKEAIVDLNKVRIDAVKKGIEKEIEAYEKLIEKKKEELDAEKDLYDFQKDVMDKQKDIADLQRQLDALSYDNSASARAKKAQLQAQIAEANADLEDTYYDRSVSNQQEALDKELENFREEKEKEIEELELYLENVEQVVADSLMTVQANATTVYDTLNSKADEYNLNLSEFILAPWKDGALAVSDYQTTFDTAMSSTMDQLDALKNKWQEVIDKMAEASEAEVSEINKENADYVDATKKEPAKPEQPKQEQTQSKEPEYNTYTVKSGDTLSGIAKSQLGNSSRWREIYDLNKDQIKDPNLIYAGQKFKIPKYAKGTIELRKSGIVNVDELGGELLLRAQNGRLTYMEKESSIIPADLTKNLIGWGKLDPSIMLDANRPKIDISPEVSNTEIHIDCSVGTLLHIDEFNGDNPDDIAKLVAKEFEKHTKNLNNALRRYAR